jgi:hypothetical protein
MVGAIAAAGHGGAMRILEAIFDRAETKQLSKDKAEARLPKKVRAQRAAATAGGPPSEWGDDLRWQQH